MRIQRRLRGEVPSSDPTLHGSWVPTLSIDVTPTMGLGEDGRGWFSWIKNDRLTWTCCDFPNTLYMHYVPFAPNVKLRLAISAPPQSEWVRVWILDFYARSMCDWCCCVPFGDLPFMIGQASWPVCEIFPITDRRVLWHNPQRANAICITPFLFLYSVCYNVLYLYVCTLRCCKRAYVSNMYFPRTCRENLEYIRKGKRITVMNDRVLFIFFIPK